MAAFDMVHYKELMANIDRGTQIAVSVRALSALPIPSDVARDSGLFELLGPMRSIQVLKEPIQKIFDDLKETKETEEKRARRNELARIRRQLKRKAEEEGAENEGKENRPAPKKRAPKKTPMMKKAMRQAKNMGFVY